MLKIAIDYLETMKKNSKSNGPRLDCFGLQKFDNADNAECDPTANTNYTKYTNKTNTYARSDSRKKSKVEFVDLTNDDQLSYSDNETHDQLSHTPIYYNSYDDYGFPSRTVRVTQDGQNLKISNKTHLQNSIDPFCDMCTEATCDECKGYETCYNLRVAALLNKYSYGQLHRISRDPNLNETQRTLIFEAYRNIMREKFQSYNIIHEHKARGKIYKINKNLG